MSRLGLSTARVSRPAGSETSSSCLRFLFIGKQPYPCPSAASLEASGTLSREPGLQGPFGTTHFSSIILNLMVFIRCSRRRDEALSFQKPSAATTASSGANKCSSNPTVASVDLVTPVQPHRIILHDVHIIRIRKNILNPQKSCRTGFSYLFLEKRACASGPCVPHDRPKRVQSLPGLDRINRELAWEYQPRLQAFSILASEAAVTKLNCANTVTAQCSLHDVEDTQPGLERCLG
jgi:hypothetical protein